MLQSIYIHNRRTRYRPARFGRLHPAGGGRAGQATIRFSRSRSSLLDGGLRQAVHRKLLGCPVRGADFEAIAELGERATRRQAGRSTSRCLAYGVAL
jgi:hypothetical protein